MNRSRWSLMSLAVLLGACAPQGPTGPEKAAAYHAEQERLAEEANNPTPAPTASEAETTLQFPMCKETEPPPPFPKKTEGAVFRAIVLFNITEEGKTSDHCYRAIEGDRKWEERVLGKVDEWTYPVKFAGQPREKVVSYRLNPTGKNPTADEPAADKPATDKPSAQEPATEKPAAEKPSPERP